MTHDCPPSYARAIEMLSELQGVIAAFERLCRAEPGADRPSPPMRAAAIYKARRDRAVQFAPHGNLFADPAWDMLLDLFIGREIGREVSVKAVCAAAAVPATTALRWLHLLDRSGLVDRRADPHDRRRVRVRLSDDAHAMMTRWLERWG